MGSPVVRAYLNRRVSGDPEEDWLSHTWGRWVRGEGLRVLVLGCGEGWLERSIGGRRDIAFIDACDVAEEAVERARRLAREAGLERIRYHVVDLNVDPLPSPAYDVIIAHSVLHHVEHLDHCYGALQKALPPHGVLILNEYVGPSRFQFSDAQMEVINRLMSRLPETLRRSAATDGTYGAKAVPTVEEMIATDPSEAVRSDELVARTRRDFSVVEEVACGGTVLHHMLYDIVQNFDPAEPLDNRLLAFLCWTEETLVDEGLLPSDFVVMVARSGSGGAPTSSAPRPRALSRGWAEGTPREGVERLSLHARPDRRRRRGLAFESVREALHRRATGYPDCDWLTWICGGGESAAPQPGERVLVLADDEGRWVADRLAALETRVTVVEPTASDTSDPHPWDGIADHSFDWVFSNGHLGRAENRSARVAILARVLRPGGWWVGDEFLGPWDSRGTAASLHYARESLELLQPIGAPEATAADRRRWWLAGLYHDPIRRWFGPRREDLSDLLDGTFEIRVRHELAGALRQRIFAVLDAASVPDDPRYDGLLAMAGDLEEWLTAARVIENDDVAFLARRRA